MMDPPQVSNTILWHIIGIKEASMSLRQFEHHVGHHLSTNCRVFKKYQLINDIKDRTRSRRPRKTYV